MDKENEEYISEQVINYSHSFYKLRIVYCTECSLSHEFEFVSFASHLIRMSSYTAPFPEACCDTRARLGDSVDPLCECSLSLHLRSTPFSYVTETKCVTAFRLEGGILHVQWAELANAIHRAHG